MPPAGAITISVKTSKLPRGSSSATNAMRRYDFKILKYTDDLADDLKSDVEVQVYREDEVQVSNRESLAAALTDGLDNATVESLLLEGIGGAEITVAPTAWAGRLDLLRSNGQLPATARTWRYENKSFWAAPLRFGRSVDTLSRHLATGLARRSSEAVGSS